MDSERLIDIGRHVDAFNSYRIDVDALRDKIIEISDSYAQEKTQALYRELYALLYYGSDWAALKDLVKEDIDIDFGKWWEKNK
jgi:hypothetical protein